MLGRYELAALGGREGGQRHEEDHAGMKHASPHPASSPITSFSASLKGVVKPSTRSGYPRTVLNGDVTQI